MINNITFRRYTSILSKHGIHIYLMYPFIVTFGKMLNKTGVIQYDFSKIILFLYALSSFILLLNVFKIERRKVNLLLMAVTVIFMINSVYSIIYGSFQYSSLIFFKMLSIGIPVILWFLVPDNFEKFQASIFGYSLFLLTAVIVFYLLTGNYKTWRFEQGLSISLVLIAYISLMCYKVFIADKLVISELLLLVALVMSIFLFSSRTLQFSSVIMIVPLVASRIHKKLMIIYSPSVVFKIEILSLIAFIFSLFCFFISAPYLYDFLSSKGIYIRFLRLISEGGFFDSSGRFDTITPISKEIIRQNPWGIGVGSERILISQRLGLSTIQQPVFEAAYSHNIFLEFFTSFGLLQSIVLFLFFAYYSFKIFTVANKKLQIAFYVAICGGLLPLILTSSFTMFRPFWFLIGLISYTLLQPMNLDSGGDLL